MNRKCGWIGSAARLLSPHRKHYPVWLPPNPSPQQTGGSHAWTHTFCHHLFHFFPSIFFLSRFSFHLAIIIHYVADILSVMLLGPQGNLFFSPFFSFKSPFLFMDGSPKFHFVYFVKFDYFSLALPPLAITVTHISIFFPHPPLLCSYPTHFPLGA